MTEETEQLIRILDKKRVEKWNYIANSRSQLFKILALLKISNNLKKASAVGLFLINLQGTDYITVIFWQTEESLQKHCF